MLLGGLFAHGQDRTSPKKIKVKGDFTHSFTNSLFEDNFETYTRQGIYSFNKENSNIGVVYESQSGDKKTTISIYIYPAGNEASEGRLQHEYLKSMQEIANMTSNGFGATQFPVRHEGEYICNGFKAVNKQNQSGYDNLTLFECGTWFVKIRLTTNELDSVQVAKIENKIIQKYSPSDLTKLKPLDTKSNIYVAKAAFAESLMLGSIMGSAFKKLEWANKNIKENEKASGFPDIYLEMQVESIKELLEFKKKHESMKVGTSSKKYLDEVTLLINSGFLAEFIMKQFNMILIVPDKQTFNFDGYEKWRQTNNLTLDLNNRYYVIAYGHK
jgi:hypothetical protein